MVLRRTLSISKVPTDAQDKEVVKFKAVVRGVFSLLDKHKKGYLTREAVCDGLKNLELPSKQDHVEDLFSVCDVNQDGVIHYAQFEALAMHRRAQLADVFDALDHTADGFIREEDIRRALDKLDIAASDAQILKLLNRADLDHDGKISLKEFQHFLILCTSASVAEVFDYWAHASAIDIGESMTAPDNFETRAQAVVTFVAGAIAGAVSRTATAPFDRLKTLLQSGKTKTTIVKGMKDIYMNEGVRAFWNGNGANVIKIMPESAIRFLGYEVFKTALCHFVNSAFEIFLKCVPDPDEVTIVERFIAGALAGSVAQLTIYPLELAKTRLAVAEQGEFKGIVDCVSRTFRADGARGLFRGLQPSLMGIVPYSGVDLAVFYTLRERWMMSNPDSKEGPGVMTLLGFGAMASTCGQLVAYPLQLVRTKLQAQGVAGVPYSYTGTWDCFRRTLRFEGVTGFYRGLGPNFLKALPAIAISYAIFEKARTKLSSYVPRNGNNGRRRVMLGGEG